MRVAFSGVQTLFLVSGWGPTRLEQHYSAIDAAVAAGVERRAISTSLRPGFDPVQDEVDQRIDQLLGVSPS